MGLFDSFRKNSSDSPASDHPNVNASDFIQNVKTGAHPYPYHFIIGCTLFNAQNEMKDFTMNLYQEDGDFDTAVNTMDAQFRQSVVYDFPTAKKVALVVLHKDLSQAVFLATRIYDEVTRWGLSYVCLLASDGEAWEDVAVDARGQVDIFKLTEFQEHMLLNEQDRPQPF